MGRRTLWADRPVQLTGWHAADRHRKHSVPGVAGDLERRPHAGHRFAINTPALTQRIRAKVATSLRISDAQTNPVSEESPIRLDG